MKIEDCYDINFSKINFLERKEKISSNKTFIYGASKVGKTYLIFDFLSNFKSNEYLYIDFYDLRNEVLEDIENLQDFIDKKEIKTLVLENFSNEFSLPNCENIVISNEEKVEFFALENYDFIYLQALDFEEYLLHDTKSQNETHSFNNFLKYGNLPEIIAIEENKKIKRVQEIIELFSKDDTDFQIFKILALNIDEKKSLFQLFNNLKTKIKISKDRFYETCKTLEKQNRVFFVDKFNQEKSAKKIYIYNHSFLNALTHTKKFKQEFTNMVFLEAFKEYKEIYYLDNIDFYIKNENLALVCIPFFNSFLNANLLKKVIKTALEFEIKKIEIITISNSEKIKNQNMQIEAIPFYEWALS